MKCGVPFEKTPPCTGVKGSRTCQSRTPLRGVHPDLILRGGLWCAHVLDDCLSQLQPYRVFPCCRFTPWVCRNRRRRIAITIDLKAALERARENSEPLQSAALDVELAREDRTQARGALLPSLSSFNQYRYTQGNGTSSGIFIGDDGVHVYTSQAQVHQELFSPERLGRIPARHGSPGALRCEKGYRRARPRGYRGAKLL